MIIILQSQSRGMLDKKLFFTAIQLSHKYVLSRLDEQKKIRAHTYKANGWGNFSYSKPDMTYIKEKQAGAELCQAQGKLELVWL